MLNVFSVPLSNSTKIIPVGDLSDLTFRNDKLKISPDSTVLWANNTAWNNSGDRYYADNKWGRSYKNYGSFTSQIYDLGSISSSVLDFNYIPHFTDTENQQINILIRTSVDGFNYTDFTLLTKESIVLRYYQFKIEFINNSNSFMYLQEL